MAISIDIQKDVLLKSFNVLKDEAGKNIESIAKLIGKMAILDIDVAMDMWEYIIRPIHDIFARNLEPANWKKISDYYFSRVICAMNYDSSDNGNEVEETVIASALSSRGIILDLVFGKSANIDLYETYILAGFILNSDFETADKVITLIENNKYNQEWKIGEALEHAIKAMDYRRNKAKRNDMQVEFLYNRIQNIRDETERAKANVALLNCIN